MKALIFLLITICLLSCQKQNDWLDIKTSKNDVVPQTLADYQAMMDNNTVMNASTNVGLFGADNYYLTNASFNVSDQEERNLYVWNKTIWSFETSPNWGSGFKTIEYTNVILEGLKKIPQDLPEYNSIRGQALFFRAFAYYNLAQLFCKAYTNTANTDPGLPIRLVSDVNENLSRSTLSETYEQIIKDALEATNFLPDSQPYLTRPIKAAAYAILAKAYLNMGDYNNAELFATKSLVYKPQLIDFNNSSLVNISNPYRFPPLGKNHPEILFYAEDIMYSDLSPQAFSNAIVADDLYNSYDTNDLRKVFFYSTSGSSAKYTGSYTGRFFSFTGLATNEIYLIRAECYARDGNVSGALADLNLLLRNRFKTGSYINNTTSNTDELLLLILNERRKELAFTSNIRWEDLKRLNNDIRFKKTLTRNVNGITYTLEPNDQRYVLPIPTQEISLNNLKQNDR